VQTLEESCRRVSHQRMTHAGTIWERSLRAVVTWRAKAPRTLRDASRRESVGRVWNLRAQDRASIEPESDKKSL
jgi:hypothetical protein